jgi:hypothetical protein
MAVSYRVQGHIPKHSSWEGITGSYYPNFGLRRILGRLIIERSWRLQWADTQLDLAKGMIHNLKR